MKDKNNKVVVSGFICSNFTYSHTNNKIKYYKFFLKNFVNKKQYVLPVIAHYSLTYNYSKGDFITVTGSLRSYTKNGHVHVFIFAENISKNIDGKFINHVIITGYICNNYSARTTPLKKTITDLIIASNINKNSYYIPSIYWGEINSHIKTNKYTLIGEFHSRKYYKNNEEKICYEFSIDKMVPILNKPKH